MRAAVIAFSLVASLVHSLVHAQDPASGFPSKPIRVLGREKGSTADHVPRSLAQRLQERWGQPVIVDSRSGAGGTIPADAVAKSPPDGYNLVMGHAGPFVSAVSLYAKTLPYDPLKDFAPVSMVATGVTVLVVHPSVRVSSAKEFIAYVRQKGEIPYASAGNGSISHLTGEVLKKGGGSELQ